jgi:hypothetical protein
MLNGMEHERGSSHVMTICAAFLTVACAASEKRNPTDAQAAQDGPNSLAPDVQSGTGDAAEDRAVPPIAVGMEQACAALGSNCICSEPLNTDKLVHGSFWFDPGDSTAKPCGPKGTPGGTIIRNKTDVIGSNDPAVLGRLPAGHKVDFFVRAGEGHIGGFGVMHSMDGKGPTKRAAARWYEFLSADYFSKTPNCTGWHFFLASSLKKFALYDSWTGIGKGAGYSIFDWTYNGGASKSGVVASYYNWPITQVGAWVRYEFVVLNRTGGAAPNGMRMQLYAKNVSDGGPEHLIWDTKTSTFSGGLKFTDVNDLTPAEGVDEFHVDMRRFDACKGFGAASHFMVAAWDTDSGQRIGPACEIEGC